VAVKAKAGLSGTVRKEPVPKMTRQGNGQLYQWDEEQEQWVPS
jgi:hypothetical protein